MRITLLDNFDSFTYNLVEQFCLLGAEVRVMRNDTPLPTIQAALLADGCELLVLSPGPGRPEDAGCMLELLAWARGRLPVLGVCLGHQALALAAGGAVGEARKPLHGKSTSLRFDQHHPLFDGIADLRVARYHSLVV
ncbi:anthranilate synthase component II, partial [Pseudomonas aeruginosa]